MREGWLAAKGQREEISLHEETVLYVECGGGHMRMCLSKSIELHTTNRGYLLYINVKTKHICILLRSHQNGQTLKYL